MFLRAARVWQVGVGALRRATTCTTCTPPKGRLSKLCDAFRSITAEGVRDSVRVTTSVFLAGAAVATVSLPAYYLYDRYNELKEIAKREETDEPLKAEGEGSTTQRFMDLFEERKHMYETPGESATGYINMDLYNRLGQFVEKKPTAPMLVVGPRGCGKSFTVIKALKDIIDNNCNVRVVYVNPVSVTSIHTLIDILEESMGQQLSRETKKAREYLEFLTVGTAASKVPRVQRFRNLLKHYHRVVAANPKLKFLFVFDDFEGLQNTNDPELKEALNHLTRSVSRWGSQSMVHSVIVSSADDAERCFYRNGFPGIRPFHVRLETPKNCQQFVKAKLRDLIGEQAIQPAASAETDTPFEILCEKTVDTFGTRVADLRLACEEIRLSFAKGDPLDDDDTYTQLLLEIADRAFFAERERLWQYLSTDPSTVSSVCKAATRILAPTGYRRFGASKQDQVVAAGVATLLDRGIVIEDKDKYIVPRNEIAKRVLEFASEL